MCLCLCLRVALADMDKDLDQAKALYLQMQQEGVEVNQLSLKRLAEMYRNAGETPPFTEPPVRTTHTRTHTQTCL